MQVEIYSSDDYAGMVSGKLSFYYGYEEADEDDDWCFLAKENGQEKFRKTTKEIEDSLGKEGWNLRDPKDYLLAGIAIYLLLK